MTTETFWMENWEGRDHFRDLGTHGKVILIGICEIQVGNDLHTFVNTVVII
jgi:hypothetical protein